MNKLVLLRHGESKWNRSNRFTGWTDVDLTEKGLREAEEAASLFLENGFSFDIAYTSFLKRAIRTLWKVMDVMDLMWIPVHRSWRLNERHYGALQGLDKKETALFHGDEQVHLWRRSYDAVPPALNFEDNRFPGKDPRYKNLSFDEVPRTESLKSTVERVMPYWENSIKPSLRAGNRVLISAHGNSLRALVKHLDNLSDQDIVDLEIPTGKPLVYLLDGKMHPVERYYLLDPAKNGPAV